MVGGFARLLSRTFFREIAIHGTENLPSDGPAILTPNHPNGLLDAILMLFVAPHLRIRFVAKEPLFRIPVFGPILRSIGAIPVLRKMEASGEVDYTNFFSACVETLQKGDCIVIFPEGQSLPQAYLAPLKTGAARLYFLAKEKSIVSTIIPIGLNYEKGTTFRSDVFVSIGEPVSADEKDVRMLTDAIADSLAKNVIQAETYRDRELMLLLERLQTGDSGWPSRFQRLKAFEKALKTLRNQCPEEINALRHLLQRYKRLQEEYDMEENPNSRRLSWFTVLLGLPFAVMGWILNWVPYRITDLLIRFKKLDESDAATYKLVYGLLIYPFFYATEIFVTAKWLGIIAGLLLGLTILPISYLSLQYWESLEESRLWPRGKKTQRALQQLMGLRDRILSQVEFLAQQVRP